MNRVLIPLNLDPTLLPVHPIGAAVQTLQGETMGTTWMVRLVVAGNELSCLRQALQQELDRLVLQMSHWLPQSDLSTYNRAAPGTWQALPAEFLEVLQAAQTHAADSDGAFDPSVGALVELWGFGPTPRRSAPPSEAEIEAVRASVDWQRIQVEAGLVLQPGGVQLDFSSIAKGYAVDRLAHVLRQSGVDHWMVEVGGELRGQGCKPDGQPWWVELERPSRQLPRTLLALHGIAVASSGDYRRYFEFEGRRYAHTLDPRTGRPVTHDLAAVTVLHEECMHADALATVLGVMSPHDAYDYACHRGIAALFVLRRGGEFEERMSPAFEALLDE